MQHLYIWGSQCQDEFQEIYHEEMRTSVGKKEIKTRTNNTLLGITSDIKSPNREFYQIFFPSLPKRWGFPIGSLVKNTPANAGDASSIPGSGTSPGEGRGNPLEDSCLRNPMDTGVWRLTVHGVAKSRTGLVIDQALTQTSVQRATLNCKAQVMESWHILLKRNTLMDIYKTLSFQKERKLSQDPIRKWL